MKAPAARTLHDLGGRLSADPYLRMWSESMRAHAGLRGIACAIGMLLCLTALAAPYVGLGTATDFVLYRAASLTRSGLFDIGLLIVLISLLPRPRVLLLLLREFVGRASTASSSLIDVATAPEVVTRASPAFWPTLARHLALAALVGAVAFWLDRNDLLGYIDGQYLLTLIGNQASFAAAGPFFSTNPLQGVGDVWYTTNTLWIPELRFGGLFSDPTWQRLATTWFAFIEIFLAVSLLSRWLGYSPAKAVAAGWLAVILITPLTYPALIYNVLPDAPNIATSITFPFIVIWLWEGIGRGPIWRDVLRTLAIAALIWLHFIAVSIVAVISYPLAAVTCVTFLAAAWRAREEFLRKLVCAVAIVVLLALSGLPQVLLGLIGDTAFQLYPQDLPTRVTRSLNDGSVLLRPEKLAWLVAVLGVVGAWLHTWLDTGRMKYFAIGTLLTVALIVSLGIANSFISLPGAPPLYYEFAVWAVYPIFAVSVLAAICRLVWEKAGLAQWERHQLVHKWAWLLLPLAAVLVLHGGNRLRGMHHPRPNVYPPRSTAIVEFLRSELALAPGKPYRGRVATLTGQTFPPDATWAQMFLLDIDLIRAVGNDHRTIGLWYYDIPTLVEFSQTMAPLIYAVVKRYLAYPDDQQWRNIVNMRRPDVAVLRQLGVRFVVSDSPEPAAGMRRLLRMSAGTYDLAVDEVPAPNLGVSPVEVVPLRMDRSALDWLGDPGTDFRRTALLDGAGVGPLVEATDIAISVEQGGLRVRARSGGRSLVVIPFQFSHCLRAAARNGRPPEVRRANLLLTALVFEGELDADIAYRQGAFLGADCRLRDLQDDRRFVGGP